MFSVHWRMLSVLFGCCLLQIGCGADLALAQTGANSANNFFGNNPGFEESVAEENPWDGVSRDGYLQVRQFSADVVSENGFRRMALPPSVAFADLNGDGKPDLLVADGVGYFYFYENRGPTVQEPKFTGAELLPIFLSTNPRRNQGDTGWDSRFAVARAVPRFALADWRRSGLLDLLVGNFQGELFFLPNVGSARQPAFRQPHPVESARLKAGARDTLPFNLLAPAATDWTGRGRLDLLLGEGTYSANAVRLLENVGAASTPQFNQARTFYVAYGDGREVLLPTAVDFNDDGRPDLLVADRDGKVSVHLQPPEGWKAGQELPPVSLLSFGGNDRLPGLVSLCAADFNGDGLFDLLFGLSNGRIAVALNTGTRGQPKFGPLQELRGEKRAAPYRIPPYKRGESEWKIDASVNLGNALGFVAVVNATDDPECRPAEGANCLKVGYWPTARGVFSPSAAESVAPEVRRFPLSHRLGLKMGRTYTLTFKAKGTGGVPRIPFRITADFRHTAKFKTEAGERGSVKKIFLLTGGTGFTEKGEFTPAPAWSAVTKTFALQTRGRDIPDGTEINAYLHLDIELARSDQALYLDDFQLLERPR